MEFAADRVEAEEVIDGKHVGEVETEFGVEEDPVKDGERGIVAAAVDVRGGREEGCALAFKGAGVNDGAVDAIGGGVVVWRCDFARGLRRELGGMIEAGWEMAGLSPAARYEAGGLKKVAVRVAVKVDGLVGVLRKRTAAWQQGVAVRVDGVSRRSCNLSCRVALMSCRLILVGAMALCRSKRRRHHVRWSERGLRLISRTLSSLV